ncbi:HAD family hydrolase [Protaetiibacter mangrovi]|uniref:HAD family hydrolase n=1 Tax=Protaetiibacter mangrovi TaxID=2970926 RepID=A0ABT1ZFN9_9MICO|nr:HAD family hydrolase [Protaetiibacter mangrovi]MCS0499532.1 HAD family hydrolase [Protaetiibacter mangrovi]TPX03103.1 HAD family hydrolase [Schumannella luteola]
MSIRAVLFDLDDTLFAHRESVEAGIHAHRAELGGALAEAEPAAEFARWNALEEEHYHRYLAGELDYLGQRRARARAFVAPYGIELDDEAAEAWFESYRVHYETGWRLHDDAVPCLDTLGPRRLGIITNGDLAFQTSKVQGVGLARHIPLDALVASGEVGVAKPDARIFALAAERLGVTPPEACYVGDRLHTDAIGAARAGLLGVWIDRRGTATVEQLAEAAAEGVPVIRSLTQLPSILV